MDNRFLKLSNIIEVDSIRTCFYQDLDKDYWTIGESHDFYEFVYVERGVVAGYCNKTLHKLIQGDLQIIKPNDFHNLWVVNNKPATVITISFILKSKLNIESKKISLDGFHREVFKEILNEATKRFISNELYNQTSKELFNYGKIRAESSVCSENLIKSYIELLILEFIRNSNDYNRINEGKDVVEEIINFMQSNLDKHITMKDIAENFYMSESNIKRIFNKRINMGAIDYFRNLKIEKAKMLIKENESTITEVSRILGYVSIHQFSKQFKRVVGVSPSEYLKLNK